MKRKSFIRESWWACLVMPVVFAFCSLVILGSMAYALLSPYREIAGMFLSSSSEEKKSEASGPRNLMALKREEEERTGNTVEEAKDTIPFSSIVFPAEGDCYGELQVSGTNVDCDLYYGSNTETLNKGACSIIEGGVYGIPGLGRTFFICAHNNSYFSGLKDAEIGQTVSIETNYGTYLYKIVDMGPYNYEDETAYDLDRTDENLILYTCYPFDAMGFTPYRYLVYCDYVSGPEIDLAS